MDTWQSIVPILAVIVVGSVLIARKWIDAEISSRVGHPYAQKMEDYRFELRKREDARKIAEFLSYHEQLDDEKNDEYFRRLNQLAWELFLWLPPDVYESVVRSVQPGGNYFNPLIKARQYILGSDYAAIDPGLMVRHGKAERIKLLMNSRQDAEP